MSQQVLHLDFVQLTNGAGAEALGQLTAGAESLIALDGVLHVGVIEAAGDSGFDLAFWFLLPSFADLEPFGTDPRYSRFLQGTVAPHLQAFAGADVRLEEDFRCADGPASCLALMGPEEAYDFEVRESLEAWAEALQAAPAVIGLAVGERQLYRGAAIAFGGAKGTEQPVTEPFRATVIHGEARTLAGEIS